ncbi:Type II restriction-modification systemrestriction subunit [Xenorhabdus nematophila F1]|uniref:McrB family protein n=1 Tax=Xenorhabdus nematophila TaxID=628 RepID=UPI000327594E|nr:AAA family ATPase [Xenorhabdus nematophila]CCW32962.1 Type II restriction-modification systemrestriction subunit [Xenorhabdus nematophila F1]
MYKQPIDSFVHECQQLNSDMTVRYSSVSPGFTFSNTGRRGGERKYFFISLNQMITVIEDIQSNLSEFEPDNHYIERTWRDRFHNYINDEVVNALSTVQTLPLFNLINKIIYTANQLKQPFEDKVMYLNHDYLENTLNYLRSQVADEKSYIASLSMTGESDFSLPDDNTDMVSDGNTGFNKIYYGAPGTGKSYKVDTVVRNGICFRTVFHPDTQYTDFVGALKPRTTKDESENVRITYEFRPGPFTRAFIEACRYKDQNKAVYLVIEELNRAPAAAVFGELFQLLDRKADGSSQYKIDIADPDMLAYINGELSEPVSSLVLPPNLSIIATMNSSDQAVMPMDTAFKRRWNFEYIPIDYARSTPGSLLIPVTTGNTNDIIRVSWRAFAEIINNKLKKLQIPEDRLLGHRFLSDDELSDDNTAKNTLCGKLFVYLWDDVLRHGSREDIFNTEQCNTFGELVDLFRNGGSVFTEELDTVFLDAAEKNAEKQEETESDEE